PFVLGVDFLSMVLLVLAVNTVAQVAGPAERAILPLVSTEEQFAAGVSIVNFGISAGNGLAVALVAPVLLVVFGENVVFVVAGVVLLLATTRMFEVPAEKNGARSTGACAGPAPRPRWTGFWTTSPSARWCSSACLPVRPTG